MSLQVFNTLSRKKEVFESLQPGLVKLYLCGPTVYDFLHIGNYRGVIFFNVVRRWLEYSGYKVTFVYNYTDVDDKIINRAAKDGKSASDIAETYIAEFEKDFKRLKLTAHEHNPRVTQFIPQIIKIIEKLIENGIAYQAGGDVNYSIEKFANYGKLSGKTIDDLQAGARVEIGEQKKNPLDFALWKAAKQGEPSWESPWGAGRPGWHIECSAMSSTILGDQFDIHGGGIDLIFPHHENEIAQSEGAGAHHPFVKYWMHNNFINFGAHKMSKSLGNIMRGRQFMDQYHPEILKYMILLAHYRSPVDFSQDQIDHAVHGLARIYSALSRATEYLQRLNALTGAGAELKDQKNLVFKSPSIQTAWNGIAQALDEDFLLPEVFARVFEVVRLVNAALLGANKKTENETVLLAQEFLILVQHVARLTALFCEEPSTFLKQLDDMLLKQKNLDRANIELLVQQRNQARQSKDFQKSDQLRSQLQTMGIAIQDSPQGTTWEVAK